MSAFISYPFSIGPDGSVATAQTPRKVWIDRVRAVLNTVVGDRVMRPDFGINSLDPIHDSIEVGLSMLEAEIRQGFSRFLPGLTIRKLKLDHDPETGVTSADLVFATPDQTDVDASLAMSSETITFNAE